MSVNFSKNTIQNTSQKKSIQDILSKFINNSYIYGDGKSISNIFISIALIIILFFSAIITSLTNHSKTPTIILYSIAGTLLYILTIIILITHKPKEMSPIQTLIYFFKILVITYIYSVYCIYSLVIYSHDHNVDHDVDHDESTKIINLVTSILALCFVIYSIYLLLGYNGSITRRQVLMITIMFSTISIKMFVHNIKNILK